jgi:hypothetical protein
MGLFDPEEKPIRLFLIDQGIEGCDRLQMNRLECLF